MKKYIYTIALIVATNTVFAAQTLTSKIGDFGYIQSAALKTYCQMSNFPFFFAPNDDCYDKIYKLIQEKTIKEIKTTEENVIKNNINNDINQTQSASNSNSAPEVKNTVTTIIKYVTSEGKPGPAGPAGPQGPQGVRGASGQSAPILQTVLGGNYSVGGGGGGVGATGPAGPAGPAGATGATGATGTNGVGVSGITMTSTTTSFIMSDGSTNTVANPYTNSFSLSTGSNSVNLTSNVNGLASTTSFNIINTNSVSTTSNTFTSIINGIASSVISFINSLVASVSGNVLTLDVNGVTATSTIISSNTVSTSTNSIATIVNGVQSATATIINSVNANSAANNFSVTVNGVSAASGTIINSNLINSSVNSLTSTVNGVTSSAATIINSNDIATTTNTLATLVNGVQSATATIINTSAVNSSGNNFAISVNGVNSASGTIINSNSVSTTSNTFTTAVNGVTSSPVSIINSNALSTTTNTLATLVNGVQSATATIINSNSVSTTTNTFTSIINGISSAIVSFVNQVVASVSGNTLTVAVNGVTSTASIISSNSVTFSTSSNTLTSTVNGVSSSVSLSNFLCEITGNIFCDGGNTVGANMTLGTNDAYNLNFETNNTNRMTIDTSGKVGIGTTTPSEKLQIQSGTILLTDAGGQAIEMRHANNYGVKATLDAANANLKFQTNNLGTYSDALTIQRANGYIGVNNTSPSYYLDVNGSARLGSNLGASSGAFVLDSSTFGHYFVGDTNPRFYYDRNINPNGGTSGTLLFNQGANEGNPTLAAAGGGIGQVTGGTLSVFTSNGSSLIERARFDGSGNLGIGTTVPGSNLDIRKSGNANINLEGTNVAYMTFAGAGSVATATISKYNDGTFRIGNELNAGTTHFVIDASGNIGIGTSSPQDRLHIAGATPGVILEGTAVSNQGQIAFKKSGATQSQLTSNFSDSKFYLFHQGGNRLTVDSAGNIGIGTSSPTTKLEVEGSIKQSSGTSNITLQSGAQILASNNLELTAPNNYLAITSGNNYIYNRALGHVFSDQTGATEWMRVISGLVGIGTNNPQTKLQIGDNDSQNTVRIMGHGSNKASVLSLFNYGNREGYLAQTASGLYFGNSGGLANYNDSTVSGSSNLTILNDGNIGIGTSSPIYKLDVSGDIRSNATLNLTGGTVNGSALAVISNTLNANNAFQNQLLQIQSSISPQQNTATLYGSIMMPTLANSNSNITSMIGNYVRSDLAASYTGNVSAYNAFYADNPILSGGSIGSTIGYRSEISSGANNYNIYAGGSAKNYFAGDVGIGTNSPETKLDVNGSMVLSSSGATLRIPSDGAYRVRNAANTSNLNVFSAAGDDYYFGDGSGTNNIYFQNNSGIGLTLKSGTGYVGLGTTTPGTRLSAVESNSANNIAAFINSGNSNQLMVTSGAGLKHTYNGSDSRFYLSSNPSGDLGATGYDRGGLALGTSGAYSLIAAGGGAINGGALSLDFFTGNSLATPKMTLSSSGNLGIGVTNPAYKVDIFDTGNPLVNIKGNGVPILLLQNLTGGSTMAQYNDGTFRLGNEINAGTKHFVIDTSGNIGMNTTTPNAKLHVNQSSSVSNIAVFENGGNGNKVTFNNLGSLKHLYGASDSRFALSANPSLEMSATGYDFGGLALGFGGINSLISAGGQSINGGDTGLNFFTGGGLTTPKMTITSGGMIGIGTTTPGNALVVPTSTGAVSGIRLGINANTTSGTANSKMLTVNASGDIMIVDSPSSSAYSYYKESTTAPTSAPVASGVKAVAIGDVARATALRSLSIGHRSSGGLPNDATAEESMAIGIANNVSAYLGGGFGHTNTVSATSAFAYGYNNTVSGSGSYSYGSDSSVSGATSFSFGKQNTVIGTTNFAYGYLNSVSGDLSYANGYSNTATGSGAVATAGNYNIAKGARALSVGTENNASSSDKAIAIGYKNTATNVDSVSIGNVNSASGNVSVAIGYSNQTNGLIGAAVGISNTANAPSASAFGRSNTVSIGFSQAFGAQNVASATNTSAFGYKTNVSGYYASGFGADNFVRGQYSVGLGNNVTAGNSTSQANIVAVGQYQSVTANNSVAVGGYVSFGNTVSGSVSQAFGMENTVSSNSASAFGYNITMAKDNTHAYGVSINTNNSPWTAVAASTNSVLLGNSVGGIYVDGSGNVRINGCVKDFAGTSLGLGTCLSDERLKTDISPIDSVYERFANLKTVKYHWNDEAVNKYKYNGDALNFGYLAQDVEQYFPEAVVTGEDGYKQVNYTLLNMYNIKAVTEMATIIKLQQEVIRTKKLCLGDTCINEEQLKQLLNNNNVAGSTYVTQIVSTSTSESSQASTTATEAQSNTSTPTSNDSDTTGSQDSGSTVATSSDIVGTSTTQ